jgi:hypothetical protein
MAKRKIPPLPVEFFATHPKILRLNTAGYGALWRLILHFWMTDCAPLPDSDHQRFLLARAHQPTWAVVRDEIREILDEICPELTEALALYRKRSSILGQMRDRAMSSANSKRYAKVIAPMPESYGSRTSERNRAPAPVAHVKQSGSGFVEKPR